jgi:hypothetical protein
MEKYDKNWRIIQLQGGYPVEITKTTERGGGGGGDESVVIVLKQF